MISHFDAPITVMVESPCRGATGSAGEYGSNRRYARDCLLDSLRRGEAPFASHLLYTQVLDDERLDDRARGIAAGLALGARLELTAVYIDRGVSHGMRLGIAAAFENGRPVCLRSLEHRAGEFVSFEQARERGLLPAK